MRSVGTSYLHPHSQRGFFSDKNRKFLLMSLPALLFGANAHATVSTGPTYNLQFLQGGSSAAENSSAIQDFLMGDDVPAGDYLVDILVNSQLSGRREVAFKKTASTGKVEACLNIALLEQLGLNLEKLDADQVEQLKGDDCPIVQALSADLRATYNPNRQELSISIPQAFMSRAVRGYVDPQLWDTGVNAGFVDYSLTGRRSSTDNAHSQSYNMRLLNGINLGPWRLRNEASVNSGSEQKTSVQSNRTYAQRDVTALKSQFTAGTSYTSSQIFDSVRFQGVQLQSDEAMLPDGMRDFAPVVRGVAEGNATVEVRQNGYLIYNANVPPGPFEIADFAASGSNGDLDVTVIESDGRKTTFTQSFSSLPQMVRKGMARYNLALGQYDADNDDASPFLATGGLTYGLTDNLTTFGGLMSSEGYRAENLGITRNTWLGALSTNLTQSTSKGPHGVNTGKSLQLNYAKTLSATDTTFSLAGYRFSTEGYRTLPDHVADQRQIIGLYPTGRPRTRLDLNARQTLGNRSNGSLYISGNEQRFWNLQGKSQQYQLGYSNNWDAVNYNVDISHTRAPDQSSQSNNRTQLTLSISMPLEFSGKSATLFSSLSTEGKGDYSVQSGISGQVAEGHDAYYNAQVANNNFDGTRSTVGLSARTPVARLDGSYSQGRNSNSLNFGAAGSMVAHAGGVNLGQGVGETFTLAHVQGTQAGTRIGNYAGVTTGHNGYAVVPSSQPYRLNWLGLATADLPSELELENSVQQLVPRRGSITLATFKTVAGRRVQFKVLDNKGQKLSFGARLSDQNGKPIAVVDPLGYALAMVEEDSGELVSMANGEPCKSKYQLPPKIQGNGYDQIIITCS